MREKTNIYEIDTRKMLVVRASSQLEISALLGAAGSICKRGAVVQLFDPSRVNGRSHIIGAYLNALAAFSSGRNRAKNICMEMLLFSAFTKQISQAIETMGAKSSKDFVLFADSEKSYNLIKDKITRAKPFEERRNATDYYTLEKMALSALED